jgi:LuxR family maltose regulon positive regulatory protein
MSNDPVRFWTYVLAALQTAHTGALDPLLNDLTEAQPPPLDVLLPDMVNQLAALNERLVLVLDDYHVIESEQVHASFTFLLDHLPPNLQLVISTRADPPFPLHRWRARNQLTEVRTADLRFTLAEAASFLNERMGLNLTPADVQKLEERTEGWAIGLQLAALSMQGCQDPSTFIARFSRGHHFVIEYLTGEVLSQQSEAVQSFILKTSLLDRFCAPLCQAVTDQTDSSAILKSPSPQVVYRERAG